MSAELSPVQRALLEQRKLRARLEEAEARLRSPIAVVGLGCRFPGADDPSDFWKLLRDGVDAVDELPESRWDLDALYDADPHTPGKIATRWGGFLKDVDQFDAGFFGIARREAATMDPQQRLLLEVCWEALEHAGLVSGVAGSDTGVFVGVAASDFAQLTARQLDLDDLDAYSATGYSHSVVAGRISYVLGLRGPSMAVDTACSSSLVSVHLACQAVRNGDCRVALAAGVNHILAEENFVSLSRAQMMAPDGRCKAFDESANGFVRSEGCGVVVLKRLVDAEADGDRILAVIHGSAVNQDGRSSGLTVPNGPSQTAVVRRALELAAIEPSRVSYVEAHGTGTSLGDPIEIQALGEALGDGRDRSDELLLGSVKTNVGHLESAAGICGLMKVVLSLMHDELPPTLHFSTPNPHIRWEDYPFIRIVKEGTPWRGADRVAGVSSFGFGGTNAHIVLGPAPPPDGEGIAHAEGTEDGLRTPPPEQVYLVSARTEAGLGDAVVDHVSALETCDEAIAAGSDPTLFADMAHTTRVGRSHFEHRLGLVASSPAEAASYLRAFQAGEAPPTLFSGARKKGDAARIAFLYTGQGAQGVGMGEGLYRSQATFRRAVDECAEIVGDSLGIPLLDVMFGEQGSDTLDATAFTQPAMFTLEYAVSKLWRSWGVVPSVVMGHSLGEFAAACVAGVYSLEDGLAMVTERGRLMASLPLGGMMAAVFSDQASVEDALAQDDRVEIAGVNGPANVVISGPIDQVERVLGRMRSAGIESKKLQISNGFHSRLVESILDPFERFVARIEMREPVIPVVSNVTGALAAPGEITTARYWREHLRRPVLFHQGMQALESFGADVFVETGPHGTLLGLGQESTGPGHGVWLPTLRRGRPDAEQVSEAAAGLYGAGVDIDWKSFDRAHDYSIADVPTYPFQRSRHWFEARERSSARRGADATTRWERAVAAGTRQATQVPIDLDLSGYPALWEALDNLTTAHVARTLLSLGAFAEPGQTHSAREVVASFGVLPLYERLMASWLARLESAGLVDAREDGYHAAEALVGPSVEEAWAAADPLLAAEPELRAYLRRFGAGLPEIVTGRADPLEALFPGGSFDTVRYFYRDWALTRYFNQIVAEVVSAWVGDGASILEIGAGSGGTTASVLPALGESAVEYVFTDLSDQYFHRAADEFEGHSGLRFRRYDAEADLSEQGFEESSFDVVVAANSLHTVRSLPTALANAYHLLKPGGVLVLFEVTRELTWFPMSFGLMEGWQKHEDPLRTDGPLLSPEAWTGALQAAGFEAVERLPGEGSPAETLNHHVLVARRPGDAARSRATTPTTADQYGARSDAGTVETAAGSPNGSPDGDVVLSGAEALAESVRDAPESDREGVVVEYVRRHVMDVLRLRPDEVPDRKDRLMDLGFDSLTAVELRGRLTSALGESVDIPATLIFDYPTIEAIAGLVSQQVGGADEGAERERGPEVDEGSAAPAPADPARSDEEVAALSEEEVERLLLEKLEGMQ